MFGVSIEANTSSFEIPHSSFDIIFNDESPVLNL